MRVMGRREGETEERKKVSRGNSNTSVTAGATSSGRGRKGGCGGTTGDDHAGEEVAGGAREEGDEMIWVALQRLQSGVRMR